MDGVSDPPRRDVARMQVNPPPELCRACLHQSVQPTLGRALPGHGASSRHPEPADEQLSRTNPPMTQNQEAQVKENEWRGAGWEALSAWTGALDDS